MSMNVVCVHVLLADLKTRFEERGTGNSKYTLIAKHILLDIAPRETMFRLLLLRYHHEY